MKSSPTGGHEPYRADQRPPHPLEGVQRESENSASAPSFDKILNFRDVGATSNDLSSRSRLKPGTFYRSARPDDATPGDRQLLTNTYSIKTIIDLRSKTEHINAAKASTDVYAISSSPVAPQGADAVTGQIRIRDIRYVEVNLNGQGFERSLVWKLKWSSFSRLIYLMARGYRDDAIAILGKEVMQPRGLVGLGIDTLEHSGKMIKEVFAVLADEDAYPILVHCTQGKDRTGLIVILVLCLCGVDARTIEDDYVRSETELLPERGNRVKELRNIGLGEEFAGCPSDFAEKISNHIEERYGGIRNYLESIGVKQELQDRISRILTADAWIHE